MPYKGLPRCRNCRARSWEIKTKLQGCYRLRCKKCGHETVSRSRSRRQLDEGK